MHYLITFGSDLSPLREKAKRSQLLQVYGSEEPLLLS
ncbi:uncharacterized protein METZ01_LOCUS5252 [marine metagenome]|uniref:Uncharacterized protein n=1 Tax=marine metagenome TaxID=408172 RepID=A0A381NF08_9ZZZZ